MGTSVTVEPWEAHPDIWKSRAAFFTYLRGGLRLMWSRYPAKLAWKKTKLFKPPADYTGRAKSLGECHYCKNHFAASHLEVDHVAMAGSCNSWETAAQFLKNLLDCNNNWVLACKPCHKIKSYSEKSGKPFKEALIEKRAIEMLKKGPKEAVLAFCERHGYAVKNLSNEKKRREALIEIFTKEANENSKE